MEDAFKERLFKISDGIICQQVNCCGAYGAGLSGAIAKEYPIVKEAFQKAYEDTADKDRNFFCHFKQLGTYQLINLSEDLMVANIYSQDFYGNPKKTGRVYTKADKLVGCIEQIARDYPDKCVYVPQGIGCGYGGGDWEKILQKLIDLELPNLYLLDTKELRTVQIKPYYKVVDTVDADKPIFKSSFRVSRLTAKDSDILWSDGYSWLEKGNYHSIKLYMSTDEAFHDSNEIPPENPTPLPVQANVRVTLDGTEHLWRLDTDGVYDLGSCPARHVRDFVITKDGRFLIDGDVVSESEYRETFEAFAFNGKKTRYVSNYPLKFKKEIDATCTITPITRENALSIIEEYDSQIDRYVEYIDNGAQYRGAVARNEQFTRMISALNEIVKDGKRDRGEER